MITGVYKITCEANKMFYIGSAKDIDKRFKRHLTELKSSKHNNILFQRLYEKYGEKSFKLEVLEVCDQDSLLCIEQNYLDGIVNNKLKINIGKDASGGDNITFHPDKEKIRQKISKTLKERISNLSEFERKNIYGQQKEKNGMWGKTHTEEVKKQARLRRLGKEPSNKNKKLEEVVGNERAKEIKQILSDKGKTKVGDKNPFFNKKHSNETKIILKNKALKRRKDGLLPKTARKVEIEGVIYSCLTDAAKALNVCNATICFRIKSNNKKFLNYKYIDK